MISYSRKFKQNADLVVGDALASPFSSSTFSLIMASLGDPFNEPRFWNEVQRTLKPGAHCIFTTPSYDWASSFRLGSTDEREGAALFQLSDGGRLYLPSFIESEVSQMEMIQGAGLRLLETKSLGSDVIPEPHSSKNPWMQEHRDRVHPPAHLMKELDESAFEAACPAEQRARACTGMRRSAREKAFLFPSPSYPPVIRIGERIRPSSFLRGMPY
jgi:hypothetical protein